MTPLVLAAKSTQSVKLFYSGGAPMAANI